MALPWFRVDNDLTDHPKVFALGEELGDPNAGWYLIRMWSWTMRFNNTGRLADGARTALEDSCGWRKERGVLIAALIKTGWLDVESDHLVIHGWDEKQGKAIDKSEKDSLAKKTARAEKAVGAKTARGRRADGALNDTLRDDTLLKDGQTQAFDLVTQGVKEKPSRKPPDPDAELARFLADLSEGEREIFRTYEAASDTVLRPDWELLKLIRKKMKAHPVDELCAAIKGHCADPWNREKKRFSLRAIFSDASVIASNALKGRGL